jgi:hypothetical protein
MVPLAVPDAFDSVGSMHPILCAFWPGFDPSMLFI